MDATSGCSLYQSRAIFSFSFNLSNCDNGFPNKHICGFKATNAYLTSWFMGVGGPVKVYPEDEGTSHIDDDF